MIQIKVLKVLDLVLKYEWYDMIDSGEKREEYRVISPYWVKRLAPCYKWCCRIMSAVAIQPSGGVCYGCGNTEDFNKIAGMGYDVVRFHRGYTNTTMMFNLDRITVGKGKPEWGALKRDMFIIKLGERIFPKTEEVKV